MIFKRLSLLFIILNASIAGAYSQDNKVLKLSISEAQDFALQNNRTVRSGKIDLQSASKKVYENIATGLPQFSVTANYLHQFVVPELNFGRVLNFDLLPDGPLTKSNLSNGYEDSQPIQLGVRNNITIDFTVSQLVFSGEYIVGLHASKVLQILTSKNLTKTENVTKEAVAGTYYLILVLGENERVLKESLSSVDVTYNEMVKLHEQGLNEDTDVDQVKISKANLQTLITSIESQKQTSYKLLKFQLGLGFDQNVELTDSLSGIIREGNIRYMAPPVFDLKNNVDFQLVSMQERISALMLKLEQSKYLPTIAGFYRHEEQTNKPAFNFAVKDVVGANLTFPIFTSGMRNARVSQAKFDVMKSQLARENAEQGIVMEYETALNNYQTAYSNFNTNSESMELSKKIYDKTLIKNKEGVSSSFELSQIQSQYLTAESNYYNSVLALLTAKAKLDRILAITKN